LRKTGSSGLTEYPPAVLMQEKERKPKNNSSYKFDRDNSDLVKSLAGSQVSQLGENYVDNTLPATCVYSD
jgi:hypothetical protein